MKLLIQYIFKTILYCYKYSILYVEKIRYHSYFSIYEYYTNFKLKKTIYFDLETDIKILSIFANYRVVNLCGKGMV